MKRLKQASDRKGENNPNYRGGIRKLGKYYFKYAPGHPRAVLYGKTPYVPLSVVNLEKKIGRRLRKGELAHHKDENKTNDRPSNLEVQTKKVHNQHHHGGKSNQERTRIRRLNEQKPDVGKVSEKPKI